MTDGKTSGDPERRVIKGVDMTLEEKAEEYSHNFKYDCAPFYGIKRAYTQGYKDARCWHWSKDELPKDESDVLCWLGKDLSVVGYYKQENKHFYTIDGEPIEPVAWQPVELPEVTE